MQSIDGQNRLDGGFRGAPTEIATLCEVFRGWVGALILFVVSFCI